VKKKQYTDSKEKKSLSSGVQSAFQSVGGQTGQLSLEQIIDKTNAWKPKDPRSVAFDKVVMQMIAVGNYPFSIVNETGFRRLVRQLEPRAVLKSDKYYQTLLDPTYVAVCKKIKEVIKEAAYISFTSDGWANKCNTASLMSVTAHYVDFSRGTRPKIILSAVPLEDDHTADYLSGVLTEEVLQKWGIPRDKVHAMVHDNAKNMVKAVEVAKVFVDVRCFAHTVQLVIHDGISEQRTVNDLLTRTRQIVAHFHRSEQACRRLAKIQRDNSVPIHRLKQSVQTRWNSTFYMLERVLEQKVALTMFVANYELPHQIMSNEWVLIENLVKMLRPFEQVTREVSSDSATMSLVIPFVELLKFGLRETHTEGTVHNPCTFIKLLLHHTVNTV